MSLSARILVVLFVFWNTTAQAHKPSDAYLTLSPKGANVDLQWDISLRDLDFAIGVDEDLDGVINWGEVRKREDAIMAYALARLDVESGGEACAFRKPQLLIDRHSDGAYAVLRGVASCAAEPGKLTIAYRLFADIDPQHKGLLRLTDGARTQTAVFSPDAARQTFELAKASLWRQFGDYFASGVEHIWTGYDHVLFLLSLLLPAVLVRTGHQWLPQQSARGALVGVFSIVTSFTLAHSITLALAALSIVQPNTRFVETAIAFSVVAAAADNFYPIISGRRWLVAGGFGLLHGFGFASALTDLGLPPSTMTLALAGFNLGVEGGQIAIVALVLPLAWRFRDGWVYRSAILVGGSWVIAGIGSLWLIERAFDFRLA